MDRKQLVVRSLMAIEAAAYGVFVVTGVLSIRHLLNDVVATYFMAGPYGMVIEGELSGISQAVHSDNGKYCRGLGGRGERWSPCVVDYREVLGTFESGNVLSVSGRRAETSL